MLAITLFSGEYSFLSNFHPCLIPRWGLAFPSVENAYQASKCKSRSERDKFTSVSPGEAKRLGRRVELRDDWGAAKLAVMLDLLRLKFADPELAEKLLLTQPAELVEGNWWDDRFWGQCPVGQGENHLGRLLMAVRDELKGDLHF